MITKIAADPNYRAWKTEIKNKFEFRQLNAAVAVNREMITLFWDLGKELTENVQTKNWGKDFITQLSYDLRMECKKELMFSHENLTTIRKWYLLFSKLTQLPPSFFQIPWTYHRIIVENISNADEAIFYIQETIDQNWSKETLSRQIESNLFQRSEASNRSSNS